MVARAGAGVPDPDLLVAAGGDDPAVLRVGEDVADEVGVREGGGGVGVPLRGGVGVVGVASEVFGGFVGRGGPQVAVRVEEELVDACVVVGGGDGRGEGEAAGRDVGELGGGGEVADSGVAEGGEDGGLARR